MRNASSLYSQKLSLKKELQLHRILKQENVMRLVLSPRIVSLKRTTFRKVFFLSVPFSSIYFPISCEVLPGVGK